MPNESQNEGFRLDVDYALTFPFGLLKTAQLIACFMIIIIHFFISNSPGYSGFVWFVAIFSFFFVLLLLCVHVCHLHESALKGLPWSIIEMFGCAACAVIYLIVAIVGMTKGGAWWIIVIISFVILVLFAINAFLIFWRSRITASVTSTVTSA